MQPVATFLERGIIDTRHTNYNNLKKINKTVQQKQKFLHGRSSIFVSGKSHYRITYASKQKTTKNTILNTLLPIIHLRCHEMQLCDDSDFFAPA